MGSDRWARALHDLYLVTLVIAFVATAVSFPAGVDWLVAGAAVVALGGMDLVLRQRAGYFLPAGVAVGLLTAMFPTFAAVAFGLLPLAFVRLPRWSAIVTGVVATGTPYLAQPLLRAALAGVGWQPGATIRFGPAYFAVVGIALPVLTGLFTAGAVRALNRQSLLAGIAEERRRLAHELHDTLAQGLAGVLLQLEAAEQHLDDPTAARLVTRARETAGACLVDTRRAVAALRPEQLDHTTLTDAVRQLCERAGATCVVRGTVRGCHPPVEVVALRVVQEALANAAKHAGDAEVAVTVDYRTGELRLVVRDDGRGFDPGGVEGGFGLATMRERVASVGGWHAVGHQRTGRRHHGHGNSGGFVIHVLVVDDHDVIRDGIAAILDPHEDLAVVGEAADGEAAVRLAVSLRPDVVLMDLRMPGVDGASATERITALSPAPRVLVLTTYDTDADITRAMAAGAIGYVLKDIPRAGLLDAIRRAHRGEAVLAPSVATKLVRQQHTARPSSLSEREREVLTLVATGATNRDIAATLVVSEATVKTYLTRVFAKLEVSDRTAAVTVALARDLIARPSNW